MNGTVGIAWDSELLLNRLVNDCGASCQLLSPQLLAAPFFRGRLTAMIVPTGFANRRFSRMLPALRASSTRIKRFVEGGGRLLVFGAMDTTPGTYDWLPLPVTYHHEYFRTKASRDTSDPYCCIIDGFEDGCVECDGYFTEFCGETLLVTPDGRAVMIAGNIGKGTVIVTSMHEYPSRAFISLFCEAAMETLF